MAEQQQTAGGDAGAAQASPRRSTSSEIAHALDLGWRIAALHAISPRRLEPPTQISEDMLLNRRSLSAGDRLELELRAIAGVAARVHVPVDPAELQRLLELADAADKSDDDERTFREAIAERHVVFEKRLWANDEASGKAYELGNFLSDTWNRVVRPRIHDDPHSELAEIFDPVRVGRIKLLLDDLQARVDPVAAHAVSNHLDQWCESVLHDTLAEGRGPAEDLTTQQLAERLEPVERQTIIWRQMLTGDKEPEAWISQEKRAQVRDEFSRQLWGRYRRWWWVPIVFAVAGAALGYFYTNHATEARTIAAGALALLGTFGVTRASMIGALKGGVQSWGELMWERSLAVVICRATSVTHDLYPAPTPPPRGVLARLRR
ncbi:MAG TPA: hypothetical protein VGO80_12385 [Solirubrobacteraceae bacterium]|jgi:hypothetical protein|nr:hypothetical protein [Solirubrobacteraceae bacterium]